MRCSNIIGRNQLSVLQLDWKALGRTASRRPGNPSTSCSRQGETYRLGYSDIPRLTPQVDAMVAHGDWVPAACDGVGWNVRGLRG
jgi:hypothetical protein